MKESFDIFLIVMAVAALGVFVALHFFEAGYGYLFDRRYGPPVPNRIGWVVMESPVFILMCVLWACSDRMWQAGPLALFALFQTHYLQRPSSSRCSSAGSRKCRSASSSWVWSSTRSTP